MGEVKSGASLSGVQLSISTLKVGFGGSNSGQACFRRGTGSYLALPVWRRAGRIPHDAVGPTTPKKVFFSERHEP